MKTVLLGLLLCPAVTAVPWLTLEDYGSVQVVVADDASANDRLAAKEFAFYWHAATGHDAPVSNQPGDGVNVWIGVKGTPESLLDGIDLDALAPDGLHIRSTDAPPAGRKGLVIAGHGDLGALNGVYEFFEKFIGVRWIVPEAPFIPNHPGTTLPDEPRAWDRNTPAALDAIDYSYTPIFEYRWTRHNVQQTNEFNRQHRLTQNPGFGLWVHTLYTLIPPEEYFEEHPEFFSERDGKRVAPVGFRENDFFVGEDKREQYLDHISQLCFTNRDLLDVLTNNLLERIRQNPTPRIWSVSQMDWDAYCECSECSAISEAEGTPMAPMLQFINEVAERVEEEFPDHYIETLAYTWSRQLPKTVRPRQNVIIRLCSIECDFARPLNDPSAPDNVLFARDIRDWSKAAHQLYIWDYVINFSHYLLPHPNLDAIHENIRFFAENNVRGVFEQGLGAPQVAMGYIRPYLLARLLWNPYIDYEAAKDEFIDLCYREAAPQYRAYLDLLHRSVREKQWTMSTFSQPGWLDKDVIDEARALLRDGIEAVEPGDVRDRLRFELLCVEYAAIVAPPKTRVDGRTFHLEWPEAMTVAEFAEQAKALGVPEHRERIPIDQMPDDISDRETNQMVSPIEVIENERYELWVLPELEGSIIRWRDKKLGVELLKGYEEYGVRASTWQDWTHRPMIGEGPVADTYRVVESAPGRLVVEAARHDGLVVRRTMTLAPGSDRVNIELALSNPTDEPLDQAVKIHPEFYDQGGIIPEIWGRRDGQWRRLNREDDLISLAYGEYIEAEGYTALAYRVPSKNLTVVNEFDPEPLGGLLWFHNASSNARHVNLELLPPRGKLAPGETLVLKGDYFATEAAPDDPSSH